MKWLQKMEQFSNICRCSNSARACRYGEARKKKPKKGAPSAAEEAKEAAKGWHDAAPYPFVLASATPSLGSEHLIVPVGAAHVGIFSLATGLMAHELELPGIPAGERLAVMAVMANPNPGGAGVAGLSGGGGGGGGGGGHVVIRSMLVVATAGGKEGGKAVRVYALNEGAAQIVRVDAARAEVARSLPPPPDEDDEDEEDDEEDEEDGDDASDSRGQEDEEEDDDDGGGVQSNGDGGGPGGTGEE